jgi:hypothetical protein
MASTQVLYSSTAFNQYKSLLYYSLGNKAAQSDLHDHLKALANSTMYDHLEGGFYTSSLSSNDKFNYTKSLSNNADIIDLFLIATGIFIDTTFSVPTINSLQWLLNNLQSPDGCFFLEMENEDIQSNYYLLNHELIQKQLDDDSYQVFMSAYNLKSDSANNSLSLELHRNTEQISEQTGYHIKHIPLLLESAHQQLILLRKQQLSPNIDCLFNFKANSKIIHSLYIAATLFNRDDFAFAADKALTYITEHYNDPSALIANSIDKQWLIQALLTCLSYQWSDARFQWLLNLSLAMIETPRFIDSVLSGSHSESIINDLNILYALSSQPIFLNTAELLTKQLMTQLKEKDHNDHLLLTLAVTTKEPKVIIIRGQNFLVTSWQQQISSGFTPQQFIFAVGNKFVGPDPNRFPISASIIAYQSCFDSSILKIDTIDELLTVCP